MTTVDPTDSHEAPPQMLNPRNPRPFVETLRGWPFIALLLAGTATVGYLSFGPPIFGGEDPAPRREDAPSRLNEPRGRREMPTDYTQVQRPVREEPAPTPSAPAPVEHPQPQQRVIVQQGGRGPSGPTKAQILKAARMADLAPVRPNRGGNGGYTQANATGGGSAGGRATGKMYNPNGLTPGFDCQVDAGTNIPAMTEQRLTSESPGTVSAVATRDVWSNDKTCLAIPRGTRFVGRYQTAVAEGQVRMGIIWTGLTRPPPRKDSVELVDTVAGDPDGTAGVSGDVNEHFWRKLGFVAAASILDIGKTAITAGGEGGVGAAVAGIFANRAASPIDDWAKRQLDIPAVIEVSPREISIVLAQHLPMDDFRVGR